MIFKKNKWLTKNKICIYSILEYIAEFKNDEGKMLNTFLNYMFLLL